MRRNETPSVPAPSTRSTSNSRKTEDDLEKLINKVCATFINQLKEELSDKIKQIDVKITQVCEILKNIETKIDSNKKEISELQHRVENLEQRSKANSLRICGIKRTKDEDLPAILTDILSEKLNIQVSLKDIDYAFRLKSKNDERNGPTPIIVNFVSNMTRNKIYQAKKELKHTPISIFEDLTRARYNLLMKTKKKFGKHMAWTENGKVFAWDASTKKKIAVNINSDNAVSL